MKKTLLIFFILLNSKVLFSLSSGVNTDLVDSYLNGTLLNKKDHWIYKNIVPNKFLFEIPNDKNKDVIKKNYLLLKNELSNFQPMNSGLWEALFGKFDKLPTNVEVYLIVGAPKPYDSFVRDDDKGKLAIIFDIQRISEYVKSDSEFLDVVRGLITHEVAHFFINKIYFSDKNTEDDFPNRLFQIAFDEGLAHFLSYDDLNLFDWEQEKLLIKKKSSFDLFEKNLRVVDKQQHAEILRFANTGKYWEKYGAMTGKFVFADCWNDVKKSPKEFSKKCASSFQDFKKLIEQKIKR